MQASAGHPPVGGRVLVGYATRMGSTAEIAEAIGEELRAQGHIVLVSNCQTAPPPTEFDAVILGSPIYLRGWDKSVVSYLRTHVRDLAERPTWLFHSGPCGPGAETEQVDPPRQVRRLVKAIGANRPMTFGGRLDPAAATTRLSRWVASGDSRGDFRDWDRIKRWTRAIAERLSGEPRPAGSWVDGLEDFPV